MIHTSINTTFTHKLANTVTCPRCGGTGYLPQYRHIENGICFKCRGAKVITLGQTKWKLNNDSYKND